MFLNVLPFVFVSWSLYFSPSELFYSFNHYFYRDWFHNPTSLQNWIFIFSYYSTSLSGCASGNSNHLPVKELSSSSQPSLSVLFFLFPNISHIICFTKISLLSSHTSTWLSLQYISLTLISLFHLLTKLYLRHLMLPFKLLL